MSIVCICERSTRHLQPLAGRTTVNWKQRSRASLRSTSGPTSTITMRWPPHPKIQLSANRALTRGAMQCGYSPADGRRILRHRGLSPTSTRQSSPIMGVDTSAQRLSRFCTRYVAATPLHGVMVSSRSAPLPSVELFVPRVHDH